MTAKKKILSVVLVIALVAITVVGSSLAYFTDKDEALNTFTLGDVDIALYEPDWNEKADHTLMPSKSFDKDPYIGVEAGSQDTWVFMEVSVNKFNSWLELNGAYRDTLEEDPFGIGSYLDEDGTISGEYAEKLLANDAALAKALVSEWFTVAADYDQDLTSVVDGNWRLMNWDDVVAQLKTSWAKDSDGNPTEAAKDVTTVDIIFGYTKKLSASEYTKPLFTDVTMPSYITSEMIETSGFNAPVTGGTPWKINITAYGIQAEGLVDLDRAYDALFAE